MHAGPVVHDALPKYWLAGGSPLVSHRPPRNKQSRPFLHIVQSAANQAWASFDCVGLVRRFLRYGGFSVMANTLCT